MASVFRPAGQAKYLIEYTDETGKRRKKTGATDKAVTERMARDLENRVALRREGIVDPKDEAYRAHEAVPLSRHIADFKASLLAKGGTARHAKVSAYRALRIIEMTKARRISDLSLSKVTTALAALRDEGLALETVNHHIRAVKGFSRWLWKDSRSREHLLAHLSTTNPERDRRRERRALTPDEAARLIEATEAGPERFGLSGPDRAILYALALGTGLRSAELRALTPERFDLAANPPTATVPACYTKNHHEAVQPLPSSLAERLRPWLALKAPSKPVFGDLTKRTAEMLAHDLKAAGIAPKTNSGIADFHALRASYISHLVSSGASVKTCQELARHSTPSLTIGLYAKASLHDIASAVDSLPDPMANRPRPEALAATGTEGKTKPVSTPRATQCATHPLGSTTEVLVRKASCVIPPEDLNPLLFSWTLPGRMC